jgi:hypothetical protein
MEIIYNNAIERLDNKIKDLQYIQKLIKILDTKYKDKLIHISLDKLNINDLYNKNNIHNSRFKPFNNNPYIYQNPQGLWFSCGPEYCKHLLLINENYFYNSSYLLSKYIYEIKVNKKNILYINNLDQLVDFHKKYAIYKEDKGYYINWIDVKKIYDGLIICPYLGNEIWNKLNDPTTVYVYPDMNQYIKNSLKENIMKYPKFYLEWYRHWEASSGVIWRKKSIKKINLIKI